MSPGAPGAAASGGGTAQGILIIGYGNTLRRDDGVGVRAAERIADDSRFAGVEVLTAYQLTPELSLDIAAVSLVVFIDADVRGLPGSVVLQELAGATGDASAQDGQRGIDAGASSHHVGADEVIALARELSGAAPRAVAVGVGVADLELGEGLSAPVEAALPRVVDLVARLVADHRMP